VVPTVVPLEEVELEPHPEAVAATTAASNKGRVLPIAAQSVRACEA
jgi:hypothetical protein